MIIIYYAKKATPATKQVEKVIYQKESAEYKITSTSPAYIVGADAGDPLLPDQ